MIEEMFVRHCSPTLAGIKTANLFSCCFTNKKEMKESICKLNQTLVKKGIRVLPLRYQENHALIYVYRPSRLVRDLEHYGACRLLRERGYTGETLECYLIQLMQKLDRNMEFPHEIGLFLGYPPEDVWGFIKNKAGGYKLAGKWKVYGDVDQAKKLFAAYRKCTEIYCGQYAQGKSIERLTVAV